MIIVLLPRTFIRFQSIRTGETLLHASRLEGALVVYGDACRDYYDLRLDGDDVRIDGTLWDRLGPVISFGADAMRCHAKLLMDTGVLPEDADGFWRREQPRSEPQARPAPPVRRSLDLV
jgi:hypothetical protein